MLLLTFEFCVAQSFDVENERLLNVSKLTVKSFNGCAKKGFKSIYYFNDKGQAIKSEYYFKRQKRSVRNYLYDEHNNLTHNIEIYSINDKNRIDTNFIKYQYDNKGRVIIKTEILGKNDYASDYYSNFNDFDEPRKIETIYRSGKDTLIQILSYDTLGRITEIQNFNGDSLFIFEIRGYNLQGDLNYSLLPWAEELEQDKEGDKSYLIWFIRYAAEEYYQYTYDEQNRWTKKYLVIKDRKALIEKRKYKLIHDPTTHHRP